MDLTGKTAIITGAAGGIGRATARLMAQQGAAVVVADLNEAVLETAAMIRAAGGQAEALVTDCATDEGVAAIVARAVERFGGIDILHANAGITGGLLPRLDTSSADFMEVLRINLLGPWIAIRTALPHMQTGGAIICTASVAGLRAGAGPIPYSASKAGVVNLVQSTAMALTGRGIRVNGVAPGLIDTPMTAPLFDDARARGREDRIGQLNPLRRGGEAQEIAEAVVWLASDAARYVNGQVLAVDGGLSSQLPFTPKWSI
ncbi:SDR family NAD(P)-dependent oxidoreductase [Pararhodobacter zhoushanensis]|uniref:SDR family oxidoreductase n=1 Tax=Pararhodobacter zhoushanensis TaxID=2479545 RepID=A0ABT3GWL0_9RHOB|nr:SDR family NAD(P)-dependent oxidoreductase [Pararhodobacter zhoushanensis]MCW1931925.1 SDR family oxidoreductase [Pararhodobacter zhoushanensis]